VILMLKLGLDPQRWCGPGLPALVGGAVLLLFAHGPVRAASHSPDSTRLHQESLTEVPVTNEWCPVLNDEPVDPGIHTEFRGERVFLCCQKCLKQFRAHPLAFMGNIPALAVARVSQDSSEAGAVHDEHQRAPNVEVAGSSKSLVPDARPEMHDHADHGDSEASEPTGLITWLGRFHPMVVHFPIALLVVATVAEFLLLFTGASRFAFVARFCLWGGALGALVAAPLGWANAAAVAEDYTGISAKLLVFHRWVGVATAVIAGVALIACERSWRRNSESRKRSYRAALFLSTLLVIVAGHLGASLIYGWEYLAR